jgi:mono/diheme cytochrome c family protein
LSIARTAPERFWTSHAASRVHRFRSLTACGTRIADRDAEVFEAEVSRQEGVMRRLGILTIVFAGFAAPLAMAAGPAGQAYSGPADYRAYCASCHGATAKGDGVIANSLRKRPADLTQLAKRNEGVFPGDRVGKTIEGTTDAHGKSDMPVWAEVFGKAQESSTPEGVKARITAIVKYIETLQDGR